ncbi:MAG: hypothetical protein ACWGOX_16355, partial [Desulforhopalus sp.]
MILSLPGGRCVRQHYAGAYVDRPGGVEIVGKAKYSWNKSVLPSGGRNRTNNPRVKESAGGEVMTGAKNAMEIFSVLDKSNCKKCGEKTCLA